MLSRYLLILAIITLGLKTDFAAGETEKKIMHSIQQHADNLLTDNRFHSVSIGIYFHGQTYSGHFGELETGKANIPNDHTLYEIGSVSKTMTGLVTARAVLEGKLTLDTDINRYLAEPLSNLSSKREPVTVRDLLTHRSGIPQNLPDLLPSLDPNKVSRSSFLGALNHPQIKSRHGQFQYSNIAPELLAHILESVYKQPFESLLKNTLTTLAGMKNTTISLTKSDMPSFAYGYNESGEKMPALTDEPKLWGAAGRVKSTLPDMLRFIKFQFDSTNPLVVESQRAITSEESRLNMGYFWQIRSNQDGSYLQHHGGLYGTQNWVLIYPEYDIGISIISNSSFDGVGRILRDIADSIVDEIKLSGKKSIRLAIQADCLKNVDTCQALYKHLKTTDSDTYSFKDENELNSLGYKLLGLGKIDSAIKIFQLLVTEFPKQSNPYDSLAEAYYIKRDYANALENYQISLSLNENNTNAQSMIIRIKDSTHSL